jgi:tRNA(Ile)-lysidine synthase
VLILSVGIETTILPLKWPDDFDANEVKRFETEARALRYQALGRACRDMKITRLMVAHHADDQAETVLMRFANNRLRSGLQAMQRREWIPECEGIYGVYHSGTHQKPNRALDIPFPIEQGGIQILRPLLTFEKTRLIATCEEKRVGWCEDKTNQIKTLTSRNAIRHVYQHHRLPEALSVKSLVDVSQHMQERVRWHRTLADELFDNCLIKLDIQTGSLVVRFPPFSDLLPHAINTTTDKIQARNTAHCLLERVAKLVTPRTKPTQAQLGATAHRIYPELEELEDPRDRWDGIGKKNYCVYNVWWRFWDKPSPFDKHEHQEEGINPELPHPREWLLTRQAPTLLERADDERHMVISPKRNLPEPSQREPSWRLFDGRWWISMTNLTDDVLILRIFSKDDMHHLPTAQENKDQMQAPASTRPFRFITTAFDLLQPADLRFTLPAVFRIDSKTMKESLVGFPTLDVRTHGFGCPEEVCRWEVTYKKIDFGSRKPQDILVPGLSEEDIMAEEMKGRPVGKELIAKPKKERIKLPKRKNTLRNRMRRQQELEEESHPSTGSDPAAHDDGNDSKTGALSFRDKRNRRQLGQEETSRSAHREPNDAAPYAGKYRRADWKAAVQDVQNSMEAEQTDGLSFLDKKKR